MRDAAIGRFPRLRSGSHDIAEKLLHLQRKAALSAHQPFGRRISDFISERRLTGNWEHNSRLQQSSPVRPSVQNDATVGLVTKGSLLPLAAECTNVCSADKPDLHFPSWDGNECTLIIDRTTLRILQCSEKSGPSRPAAKSGVGTTAMRIKPPPSVKRRLAAF